jgi:CRP-like cAMP-binding protein
MTQDIFQKVSHFFAQYPARTFTKRQIMVQASEDPPGVFYLEEGRVSQYDISPAGTEVVVNVFKPGAFFPMSWAINKTPNQYFFEASTKVTVRQAPADEVVQFLQDNPDVMFNLLSRVYRGADGLLRRAAHLMGGDAKSRLIFELLNAAARFGESQTDGSILVPLREGDLARHAGLARETVNRIIRSLKTAGLIAVNRDGFVLYDAAKLEAVLGTAL